VSRFRRSGGNGAAGAGPSGARLEEWQEALDWLFRRGRAFLSKLAVEERVGVATQKKALNARLSFHQQVLGKP
jgi:hypothetical protein